MPKINVYLPDDLADAVKEAGVPVSAICQRALEQAVRRVTQIRETALGDLDPDDPAGGLAQVTGRLRSIFQTAVAQARAVGAAEVGTEHVLAALVDEGTNLALAVLRSVDVDPEAAGRELSRRIAAAEQVPGDRPPARFGADAANALQAAVAEAHGLGHNYLGTEHVLLGLIAEEQGAAGQILRGLGADMRTTRRAVTAALAGYVHLRANGESSKSQITTRSDLAAVVRAELAPLAARLDALEARVGSAQDTA